MALSYSISDRGLKFVAGWEQFVPWVYDDFAAPVRMTVTEAMKKVGVPGKVGSAIRIPPEFKQGMACHGTLTVGYGHTDAAKHPLKIAQCMGKWLSQNDALNVLRADMANVIKNVNKMVEAPVTQSMADALYSITFNFGEGNLRKSSILAKLNRKDYVGARAAFDLYVKSKGKFMQGLQNRRDAEQKLWDVDGPPPGFDEEFETHPAEVSFDDEPPAAEESPANVVIPEENMAPGVVPDEGNFMPTPKTVDLPKTKSMITSKIATTAGTIGATASTTVIGTIVDKMDATDAPKTVETVTEVIDRAGNVVGSSKQVIEKVQELSILGKFAAVVTDPVFLAVVLLVTVVGAGLIIYWRKQAADQGAF